MEKFSPDDRNPQCDTERERNEQCGGNIRTTKPPHLLKPLEDIGHEPAEIVGNHDNRQSFDRVLEDGLALRRILFDRGRRISSASMSLMPCYHWVRKLLNSIHDRHRSVYRSL